jgi:hypothetical protein
MRLSLLLLLLPPAPEAAQAALQQALKLTHVKWLTFDGYDPANQRWANLGHTGSLAAIADAHAKYGMYGLLDVEGLWDSGAASNNGLTSGWQQRLMSVLGPAKPFIENSTVKGVVMGDEPCASGVPARAMEEAALFIKAQVGPRVFVFVNENHKPFDPRVRYIPGGCKPGVDSPCVLYNGSFVHSLGRVPRGLDIISIDLYCPHANTSGVGGSIPDGAPVRLFPHCF